MLQEFRSVGKMYKKIAGKRFRLPRKVKKRLRPTCASMVGLLRH